MGQLISRHFVNPASFRPMGSNFLFNPGRQPGADRPNFSGAPIIRGKGSSGLRTVAKYDRCDNGLAAIIKMKEPVMAQHQSSKSQPVAVRLWGSPEEAIVAITRAHKRAQDFFELRPDRQFYSEAITHDNLARERARWKLRDNLNGSTEHPRPHRFNTHRDAVIDGPGPHLLLFKRDWHDEANTPWRSSWSEAPLRPGVIILPNVPSAHCTGICKLLVNNSGVASLIWEAWENNVTEEPAKRREAALRLFQSLPGVPSFTEMRRLAIFD